jgi:hypothetical protein
VTGQQNLIFNLKSQFPHKLSDVSFTNPTSTVGLQLLNFRLLNVILRCVKRWCHDHKTWISVNWKGERDMVRWAVLHTVPYIRNSLRSENIQWRLKSEMPGSNSEAIGRFCDGLGRNTIVQYSVGPIITLHGWITAREYLDRLCNQVYPMIQTLFPNSVVQFSKKPMPLFTQLEVFSHGLKNVKVNFNIFPGQHSHHIWTSLNHSGQFGD